MDIKFEKYAEILWLFLLGSLLGVLIEGIFCCFVHKRWETHVVSIFAPLCILYGFGAVAYCFISQELSETSYFLRFLIYATSGTLIELICGFVLEHFFNMYAWNYNGQFLNFHGHICLKMTLVWGIAGLLFERAMPMLLIIPKALSRISCKPLVIILSVFMVMDFTLTFVCVIRWSKRHSGIEADNRFEAFIDSKYDDSFMEKRFCEWHFYEEVEDNKYS